LLERVVSTTELRDVGPTTLAYCSNP